VQGQRSLPLFLCSNKFRVSGLTDSRALIRNMAQVFCTASYTHEAYGRYSDHCATLGIRLHQYAVRRIRDSWR
jgi:hypothetical protein